MEIILLGIVILVGWFGIAGFLGHIESKKRKNTVSPSKYKCKECGYKTNLLSIMGTRDVCPFCISKRERVDPPFQSIEDYFSGGTPRKEYMGMDGYELVTSCSNYTSTTNYCKFCIRGHRSECTYGNIIKRHYYETD